MRRRDFITGATGSTIAWLLAIPAQLTTAWTPTARIAA
jgi:hypothetical protein